MIFTRTNNLGRGTALHYSNDDIEKAAGLADLHPATFEAFVQVKWPWHRHKPGVTKRHPGWFNDGRLEIVFNQHEFHECLPEFQSLYAKSRGIGIERDYRNQRTAKQCYRFLSEAIPINRDAAFKALGMGRFRLYWRTASESGYVNAETMFLAFSKSEALQLFGLARSLHETGIAKRLRLRYCMAVEDFICGEGHYGRFAEALYTNEKRLRNGKWKHVQDNPVIVPFRKPLRC